MWSMEDWAGWDREQRYSDYWRDPGLSRELDADSATHPIYILIFVSVVYSTTQGTTVLYCTLYTVIAWPRVSRRRAARS
jgi:hypothetical protein